MKYTIGDTITYKQFGGTLRTGTVTNHEDDIKNGEPGFDIVDENGDAWWGYDHQIVRVG